MADNTKKPFIEGTDEIDEAVTTAASIVADAFFNQNGMESVAEEHDDTWYVCQEKIREVMLNAAIDALSEYV